MTITHKQGIRVRSLAHNYVYYRPGFVVYVFKDFTQKLKLRTDTCEYAFNWFPRGRDTSFSLWLGNSYKDGSLLGKVVSQCTASFIL